jgi:hypothetical protein
MVTGVVPVVDIVSSTAVSSDGITSTDTAAVAERPCPSDTMYVKVSTPIDSKSGV